MHIQSQPYQEQKKNLIETTILKFNSQEEKKWKTHKKQKGQKIKKQPQIRSHLKKQKNKKQSSVNLTYSHLFLFIFVILVSVLILLSWKVYDEHVSQQVYEVNELTFIPELPICAVIFPNQKYSQLILTNSVQSQNYTNKQMIVSKNKNVSYYDLKQEIRTKCIKFSLIVFVNSQLQIQAFSYINKQMQHFRSWVMISRNGLKYQILAFFYRIYDLIQINDFQKQYVNLLLQNNRSFQAQAMSTLCQLFLVEGDRNKVIAQQEQSYFAFNFDNQIKTSYKKILRLSQDYDAKTTFFQKKQFKTKYTRNKYETRLGKTQLLRALDRQQLLYLPENHTICRLQLQEYESKYQLSKYLEKQVRFCITVLSHNNIQNRRYAKVIDSIIQQKYDNYHIVFIDDFSDDTTMKQSIKYFEVNKFPKDRLKFVQNLDRNFATYNIMNAAFNFCADDDIQVLMDGDDEFIGKYAFQTMNSFYQRDPGLWVVHSNFKISQYDLGLSEQTLRISQRVFKGIRVRGSFLGPIRTWRVGLIRAIPMKYHQLENGNWLDTMYDEAFARSLIQLAGVKRFMYVPEVLYEYNTNYGDNDNSNQQKVKHRQKCYEYMLNLPLLEELKQLDGTEKVIEAEKALKKDKDIRYKLQGEQS